MASKQGTRCSGYKTGKIASPNTQSTTEESIPYGYLMLKRKQWSVQLSVTHSENWIPLGLAAGVLMIYSVKVPHRM